MNYFKAPKDFFPCITVQPSASLFALPVRALMRANFCFPMFAISRQTPPVPLIHCILCNK